MILIPNRLVLLAVVKDIEIIGEAANQLSTNCREQAPHLPWPEIIGMRNRLVHAYFEIDVEIVWAVVTQDLPALLPDLEQLITAMTHNIAECRIQSSKFRIEIYAE